MCIFATDMKKLLYISVFFLLLASCTDDKEVMPVLERAEAYLPEYPDSAGMLLDSISSRPLGESGERIRSLYGLLRTMTDAMTGKGVTTDSLIRPSYIYYKEQGESDEHTRRLGRSAFYLARYEASRDSTKQAEDLYREAIHYSEQVEDWRTCYLAYTSMARILSKANVAKGIEHGKKALQVYGRIKDKPSNLIIILHDLCYDYINIQQMDSALYYAQVALDVMNNNDIELQYKKEALKALSSVYYYLEDYKQAVFYAKLSMADYESFSNYPLIYNLAECYLACDSIQQAERLLLQLRCSSNYEESYVAYRDLTRIAIIRHQQKLAELYTDSACSMLEQMYYKSLSQKDVYYDALLQQEQESERQHIASLKQQIIFGICLIVAFLVVVLVVAWFVRYKKRQARGKAQLLDKAESLANSLDDTRREYQLFKTDKEQYERTLQRQIQELENQNNSMRDRIVEYKEDDSELMNSDIVQFFVEKGQGVFGEGKVKKSELSALEKAFKKHLKHSYRKYKQSNLTDFQLQVAILTRLNFTTKEIAQIFVTSQSSISNTKAKINADLFGENTSESLYNNLLSVKSFEIKE